MKAFFKFLSKLLAVFAVLLSAGFAVYWFNLDMKLVRKIYDKLQPHYDILQKDKKL